MRALVTGGAGFIGSHLVDRLLAAGYEVAAVDNFSTGQEVNLDAARSAFGDKVTVHRMDIRSRDVVALVEEIRPTVVYHLAAQADVRVSVAQPTLDAEINIIGSLNVFEGALRAGARKVVFAGSGGTLYGDPDVIPTPENTPQRPISPYGVAKKASGDYLHYFSTVQGMDYTILALANIYGPRQDPYGEAGVVAIFGDVLLNGRTPTIFGDGEQTRDFVFVKDVVEAFTMCADAGSGLLANLGTGRETTVNELFRTMASLTGFTGEPIYADPRAGELRRSALDSKLLAAEIGWQPRASLSEGLSETLDWLRQRASGSE